MDFCFGMGRQPQHNAQEEIYSFRWHFVHKWTRQMFPPLCVGKAMRAKHVCVSGIVDCGVVQLIFRQQMALCDISFIYSIFFFELLNADWNPIKPYIFLNSNQFHF